MKHWVRNIVRGPHAYWLPTSTDRFYPDFVAELIDGRMLVLEYKGLTSPPTRTRPRRPTSAPG
ncbi:hypothetical protein [Sphingomonas rhizophila]|uniref:hypothetical protein n=1 Tax=Sphingomonas rhizophila TaxID=2071607 RepID=UPI001FE7DA90|nr:hypothetical protein [Sphingomonas rhizophila]